ncbi:MAG: N-glycosylase/DNA lyase [Thermoproteota archaeon]|nr:N-glycosylase/DNA lyase [Thermoproteota archaeon]
MLNEKATPFNLEHTLDCGQVFRWEKKNDCRYGIVGETIIKLKQEGEKPIFEISQKNGDIDFIRNYFRLDDDLPLVITRISRDAIVQRAVEELYGLRIIRQDPWECFISYICATFSNISRVRGMVWNLSRRFGRKIAYDGLTFYTFPSKKSLAEATAGELLDCKLGFRARYVREAAKMIEDCDFDFEALKKLSYGEAKKQLLCFPGVGHKVADCILLFSLEKLEAFPIDVWVKRIVSNYYYGNFPEFELIRDKELTPRLYNRISAFGREYFGEYAGYAQEYLFHYYRFHSQSLKCMTVHKSVIG